MPESSGDVLIYSVGSISVLCCLLIQLYPACKKERDYFLLVIVTASFAGPVIILIVLVLANSLH